MKRLTERIKRLQKDDLIVYTNGKYKYTIPAEMTNDDIREVLKKLAAYEDLEEQGLLVRLPCPIGTTVWDICGMDILENVLSGIECDKDGKQFLWANDDEWLGELNNSVFLTREEAEKKLEELKHE